MRWITPRFFMHKGQEHVALQHKHDSFEITLKVTDEEREIYADEYRAFKPEEKTPMSSKVEQVGNRLKGFYDKLDQLVDKADQELSGAEKETETAVGAVTNHAKEVRGHAASIMSLLSGSTNNPPTDGAEEPAPVKKGLFK